MSTPVATTDQPSEGNSITIVTPPPAQPDPTAWLTAVAENAATKVVSGQWSQLSQDVADLKAGLAAHPAQLAALEEKIAALQANPSQQAAVDAGGIASVLASHKDQLLAEIPALVQAAYNAATKTERPYIRYGVLIFAVVQLVILAGLALLGNHSANAFLGGSLAMAAALIGLVAKLN